MSSATKSKAPKGRSIPAQGNALGTRPQRNESPEGATYKRALPPGWRWVTLREIAQISGGVTKGQKRRESEEIRKVPYLRVANVQRGYLDLTEVKEIEASEREIQVLRLQPGDILFNEGGDRDKLGRGWVWNGELPECVHQNHVFRARLLNPENSPKYISFYGNSEGQRYFMEQGKQTTNLASINLTKLGQLPIPLPPPDQQRRIVEEIEKQFTRLAAGVAALHRVQANLKRYRASVLKAACEGRLVPTEAELARAQGPSFETGKKLLSRILAERHLGWKGRGKYREPELCDEVDLSSMPEGWAWATVEQLTSLVATGATPYRGNPRYWEAGTFPWVTSGALNEIAVDAAKEFITPLAIEETNAKLFPRGTLLVALYGEGKTRGMVSELRIDAATNQACAALLFDEFNRDLKDFLRISLLKNYDEMRLLSSGGVQPNLSLAIVRQTKVGLPPLAEQARIVAEVERRLSVLEGLEVEILLNLKRARRLKQSILQSALGSATVNL